MKQLENLISKIQRLDDITNGNADSYDYDGERENPYAVVIGDFIRESAPILNDKIKVWKEAAPSLSFDEFGRAVIGYTESIDTQKIYNEIFKDLNCNLFSTYIKKYMESKKYVFMELLNTNIKRDDITGAAVHLINLKTLASAGQVTFLNDKGRKVKVKLSRVLSGANDIMKKEHTQEMVDKYSLFKRVDTLLNSLLDKIPIYLSINPIDRVIVSGGKDGVLDNSLTKFSSCMSTSLGTENDEIKYIISKGCYCDLKSLTAIACDPSSFVIFIDNGNTYTLDNGMNLFGYKSRACGYIIDENKLFLERAYPIDNLMDQFLGALKGEVKGYTYSSLESAGLNAALINERTNTKFYKVKYSNKEITEKMRTDYNSIYLDASGIYNGDNELYVSTTLRKEDGYNLINGHSIRAGDSLKKVKASEQISYEQRSYEVVDRLDYGTATLGRTTIYQTPGAITITQSDVEDQRLLSSIEDDDISGRVRLTSDTNYTASIGRIINSEIERLSTSQSEADLQRTITLLENEVRDAFSSIQLEGTDATVVSYGANTNTAVASLNENISNTSTRNNSDSAWIITDDFEFDVDQIFREATRGI